MGTTLILVSVLLAVWVVWLVRRHRYLSQWDHFPGYKGWQALPILGHMHMLGTKPICALFDMQKRFGDVFRLDFGQFPTIVIANYEDGAEAFKSEVK